MILSTWNLRGLNNPSLVVEIKKYSSHNKVNFIGILETEVN